MDGPVLICAGPCIYYTNFFIWNFEKYPDIISKPEIETGIRNSNLKLEFESRNRVSISSFQFRVSNTSFDFESRFPVSIWSFDFEVELRFPDEIRFPDVLPFGPVLSLCTYITIYMYDILWVPFLKEALFSPYLDGFVVLLSDGRAALVAPSMHGEKFNYSQTYQGIWAPGLTNSTTAAINNKYRLLAFGTLDGDCCVFGVDDVTGALVLSHKMILDPKYYPGNLKMQTKMQNLVKKVEFLVKNR